MERRRPTAPQEGPSVPGSIAEEENGSDQVRPPRVQYSQYPVARKATKKRKALELNDESGGEIEKERKTKKYYVLVSRLFMCDVFYRVKRDRI